MINPVSWTNLYKGLSSLTSCVSLRVKKGFRYLASSHRKPFRSCLWKIWASYSSSVSSDKCSDSMVLPWKRERERHCHKYISIRNLYFNKLLNFIKNFTAISETEQIKILLGEGQTAALACGCATAWETVGECVFVCVCVYTTAWETAGVCVSQWDSACVLCVCVWCVCARAWVSVCAKAWETAGECVCVRQPERQQVNVSLCACVSGSCVCVCMPQPERQQVSVCVCVCVCVSSVCVSLCVPQPERQQVSVCVCVCVWCVCVCVCVCVSVCVSQPERQQVSVCVCVCVCHYGKQNISDLIFNSIIGSSRHVVTSSHKVKHTFHTVKACK